jgi:hypothetical protein
MERTIGLLTRDTGISDEQFEIPCNPLGVASAR